MYCFCSSGDDLQIAPSTGATSGNWTGGATATAATNGFCSEYILAATGTQSTNATWSTATNYGAIIMGFYAPIAGSFVGDFGLETGPPGHIKLESGSGQVELE